MKHTVILLVALLLIACGGGDPEPVVDPPGIRENAPNRPNESVPACLQPPCD